MPTDTTEIIDGPPSAADAAPKSFWTGGGPYVVPMALFLLLTFVEGKLPAGWYVPFYGVKAVVVTAALLVCRRAWQREITLDARVLPLAIGVGLAVFAEWVLLDQAIAYPHLGARVAYNPFVAIADPALRAGFFALRFYGLVLMVPVMEEVFWRSFLLRWISDMDDFKRVRLGAFTWVAFFAVAALFAGAHSEWLVAFLCACAYGLLLRSTRSLLACIVAHAVTNFALGIYVVTTGNWRFW